MVGQKLGYLKYRKEKIFERGEVTERRMIARDEIRTLELEELERDGARPWT